ncbi:MAG: endonuclease III [Candidatus Zixiibacteriota bacterium]|nr:MAG: endonuclease III [candidate division Zixibacteria bacterium]
MNKHTASAITRLLKRAYPDAKCSLDFKSPIQLAVATILSAQSTDERVNLTTPALFRRYKTVRAFANADQAELEELIKSVGLYRNKAKSIIALAKALECDHGSRVPTTLTELQKLPGVGRKTANVIQGVLTGKGEGIAVDTHVTRLSFRIGFTKSKEPKKIEQDLKKWIDPNDWVAISHLLIRLGREVCKARNPMCDSCFLAGICPRRGIK